MSFNFNKIGRQVAKINNGKYNGCKVYLSEEAIDEKNEYVKEFNAFNIPDEGKFQQMPNKNLNREVVYIVGPSGSGKTTYTTNYIKEIQKIRKDYPVYIFSSLNDDYKELDVKRVKIDKSLVDNPISAEELANSICVFDDVDVLSDKKIRTSLLSTLDQVLEIGRHFNIYLIMTNHLASNGKDTRRILNECHTITYFPQAGGGGNLNYMLEKYGGLNKKQIEAIKKLKTRWATLYRHYPQFILTEKNIFLLHNSN